MDRNQRLEEFWRNGDSPEDTAPALFEAFEQNQPGAQVDPVAGQCEGFGNSAARQAEGEAERVDVIARASRGAQEGLTLSGREVFPLTGAVEQERHRHSCRHGN